MFIWREALSLIAVLILFQAVDWNSDVFTGHHKHKLSHQFLEVILYTVRAMHFHVY